MGFFGPPNDGPKFEWKEKMGNHPVISEMIAASHYRCFDGHGLRKAGPYGPAFMASISYLLT
jgi:hypothetical protein